MSLLTLRNRQRTVRLDQRHLRRIIRALMQEHLARDEFDLGIFLVGEKLMTEMNKKHLGHAGCTDVITFDYTDQAKPGFLAGEIFVCVPEAIRQAQRFRVTWESELVRYVVHGVLHLMGYDDGDPVSRKKMKREENRLVKSLAENFRLHSIAPGDRHRSKQS